MSSQPNNILITGGNGNLGCKLVDYFKDQYNITIVDKSDASPIISECITNGSLKHSYIKLNLVMTSQRDIDTLDSLIANNDIIIHNAHVNCCPDSSWDNSIDSLDINNMLFLRCIEAIKTNPKKKIKIIYASSNHIMGGYLHNDLKIETNSPPLPGTVFKDTDTGFETNSTAYASVKLGAERLLKTMCDLYPNNIQCIIVRIGWCPQPHNSPNIIRPFWGKNREYYMRIHPKDYNAFTKMAFQYFQGMWLSNGDLCRLYECCVQYQPDENTNKNYIIVNGVSNNENTRWDLTNEIGYVPTSNIHSKL